MTPKEKSFELAHKFRLLKIRTSENSYMMISMADAKQCALIAIDELIYFSSNQSLSVDFDGDYYCDHDFFVEVKKEIEAL